MAEDRERRGGESFFVIWVVGRAWLASPPFFTSMLKGKTPSLNDEGKITKRKVFTSSAFWFIYIVHEKFAFFSSIPFNYQ